jgi:hypothetical protein
MEMVCGINVIDEGFEKFRAAAPPCLTSVLISNTGLRQPFKYQPERITVNRIKRCFEITKGIICCTLGLVGLFYNLTDREDLLGRRPIRHETRFLIPAVLMEELGASIK